MTDPDAREILMFYRLACGDIGQHEDGMKTGFPTVGTPRVCMAHEGMQKVVSTWLPASAHPEHTAMCQYYTDDTWACRGHVDVLKEMMTPDKPPETDDVGERWDHPDDVHSTHCCPKHGCKYMNDDCPVFNGGVEPTYPNNNGCEYCQHEFDDSGPEIESVLEDLSDRLLRAEVQLLDLRDNAGSYERAQRLKSKREGVALAKSYVDEALRMWAAKNEMDR